MIQARQPPSRKHARCRTLPTAPLADTRSILLMEATMRVCDRKPAWRVWGATPAEWLLGAAFTVLFVAVMLPACGRAHRSAADEIRARDTSTAAAVSDALVPS